MTSCIFLAVVTTVCLVTKPTPATTFAEIPKSCNCGTHGICLVLLGGTRFCQCFNGYQQSTDGLSCERDNDECELNNGGCEHHCLNTPGSFYCACPGGFKLLDNEKDCVDRDECAQSNGGCQHNCVNSEGSFECTCNEGYMVDPNNSYMCADVDECSQSTHECEQECVNYPGSYHCGCNDLSILDEDGKTCHPITCSPLLLPDKMKASPKYLCLGIHKTKEILVGTTCRVECEKGYELKGTKNRTCRRTGQWSAPPASCILIATCEKYLPPSNGYQSSCNTTDMMIGTLCNLTCSEGYEPEGRLQIRCHLNEAKQVGEWSTTGGGRCNAKTCPILVVKMHNMRIIPPYCMERQLDYKSQCFYVCDHGFQLRGVSSRTCQVDGTWSDPSVQNTCIDIEPPEFITCPSDISLPTDLHQNFTTNPANWDQPEARDNDGEPVIEASPSATQQRFYLDEVTVITYTARDAAGLESRYSFSITVKDEEPPQVNNCPNSIAVKTDNRLAVVYWDEPVFQDNSEHGVSVIFNRPSGSTFFFGQPESIWYIAEDQAGNTARCEFTVSEEDLEPPEFITCPEDIVLPTNLHENFTTTSWDKPEARDNTGKPTVEASLSAAKERFYLDEVTVVTYTARDRAGLESTCTFSITVRDEEPPQVVSCPDSITVETRGSSKNVHWAEPVFQDNSGKEVSVTSNFPSGFTFFCSLLETVQYIAEDQAGNTVMCEFTVDVTCMK